MKKYVWWFKLALTTFLLGLLSVFVWVSFRTPRETSLRIDQIETVSSIGRRPEAESEKAEIPELSFCELVNDPESYTGKTIKLKGIFAITQHGTLFGGECPQTKETLTVVSVSLEQWKEIDAILKLSKTKRVWGNLDMQAVGKFEKNTFPPPNEDGLIPTSDLISDRARYKFELIKIETAAERTP